MFKICFYRAEYRVSQKGVTRDVRPVRNSDSRLLCPKPPRQVKVPSNSPAMASKKPNKLAFLSMPAPASYVAGLGRGYVLNITFATQDSHKSSSLVLQDLPHVLTLVRHEKARLLKSLRTSSSFFHSSTSIHLSDFVLSSEAQARRGEEIEVDPDQFQDPDNEYGLFAGTTYEQDDEEADKIYESIDDAMDSRRRARRWVVSYG